MTGKVLCDEFLPERLRIVKSVDARSDEHYAVVKEILDHRGSIGNFEYKVKWLEIMNFYGA